MTDSYRQIVIERHGNVAVVRLARTRLDENEIYELSRELHRLATQDGCPRIVLCLGPETPECLYSVFLAKLISLQRRLDAIGGALKLCQCTPQVIEILDVCVLLDRFDLVDSPAEALAQWGVDPDAETFL
jgi:anti-anti-sigma factor